jgi:hypothetical protein
MWCSPPLWPGGRLVEYRPRCERGGSGSLTWFRAVAAARQADTVIGTWRTRARQINLCAGHVGASRQPFIHLPGRPTALPRSHLTRYSPLLVVNRGGHVALGAAGTPARQSLYVTLCHHRHGRAVPRKIDIGPRPGPRRRRARVLAAINRAA